MNYQNEAFRIRCKNFLTKYNKNYDKFTIVSHDSFIGYISELRIKLYLEEKGLSVISWRELFDIRRILNILNKEFPTVEEIDYVKDYFYDKWDLKIVINNKNYFIDVKTALTELTPNKFWKFLYPTVQIGKKTENYFILLAYYVVEKKDNLDSLKNITIIGYTEEEKIKKCSIIKSGDKTQFSTISQINNFETKLNRDYDTIDNLIINLNKGE